MKGEVGMNRMKNLRETVARVLAENFHEDPGPVVLERDRELADAVLAALGLNDRLLEAIADSRYSDEWVGNAIRSRFTRSATQEGEDD